MGSVRPPEGASSRRDTVNPIDADAADGGRAGAPGDARPDQPADSDAGQPEQLVAGTSLCPAVVAALLLTTAATPFLKGILAGFALAGAAAAVRSVLDA